MQDPLKQGLKPSFRVAPSILATIRMQDPLKQGLKPKAIWNIQGFASDSNARSTKTRIETDLSLGYVIEF